MLQDKFALRLSLPRSPAAASASQAAGVATAAQMAAGSSGAQQPKRQATLPAAATRWTFERPARFGIGVGVSHVSRGVWAHTSLAALGVTKP
jgi:hypothetical protein